MRTAREMYPDSGTQPGDHFYAPGNYTPIVEAIGEIIVREDSDDYRGDTFALVKGDERYGYVQIGWGSCSGCDALQACESFEDIDKLAATIAERVQWFANATAALEWFRTHDWQGEWSWHSEKLKTFVERATAELEKQAASA